MRRHHVEEGRGLRHRRRPVQEMEAWHRAPHRLEGHAASFFPAATSRSYTAAPRAAPPRGARPRPPPAPLPCPGDRRLALCIAALRGTAAASAASATCAAPSRTSRRWTRKLFATLHRGAPLRSPRPSRPKLLQPHHPGGGRAHRALRHLEGHSRGLRLCQPVQEMDARHRAPLRLEGHSLCLYPGKARTEILGLASQGLR